MLHFRMGVLRRVSQQACWLNLLQARQGPPGLCIDRTAVARLLDNSVLLAIMKLIVWE